MRSGRAPTSSCYAKIINYIMISKLIKPKKAGSFLLLSTRTDVKVEQMPMAKVKKWVPAKEATITAQL